MESHLFVRKGKDSLESDAAIYPYSAPSKSQLPILNLDFKDIWVLHLVKPGCRSFVYRHLNIKVLMIVQFFWVRLYCEAMYLCLCQYLLLTDESWSISEGITGYSAFIDP